jgi:hypothetical protein
MNPDQPIPFWPTPKPAHHEASIPYWPTEPEATGFWSDSAWAELCAYADRFDAISAQAEWALDTWADDGRPFEWITADGAWYHLGNIEAARQVREMGPLAWGVERAARAIRSHLGLTTGHSLEDAGWNLAMRSVRAGIEECRKRAPMVARAHAWAAAHRAAEGC